MSTKASFTQHSLRTRILWLVSLASLVAAAAVAISVVVYEVRSFRPRALEELSKSSLLLQEVLPAALDFGGTENAAGYLKTFAQDSRTGMKLVAVYDTDGTPFAYWRETEAEVIPVTAAPTEPRFKEGRLEVWQPIVSQGREFGHLLLVRQLPPLYARLPQYGIMLAVVLGTLAAVGVALILGTRHYIIGPLLELLKTTTAVTLRSDYNARARVKRNDEVGELARAFNQMLEAIGARENELREARARVEQVFKATTELAIIAIDRTGYVTTFNVGAERMLGYSAAEVVGKATPMLWHKREEIEADALALGLEFSDHPTWFEKYLSPVATDQFMRKECTFISKDKKEFPVHLSVTPIRDPEGNLAGFLGVATDLSQQKHAQQAQEQLQMQLIQSQKLEAVGQLAGGIAHDFNNILAAMMMHSELMQIDLHEGRAVLDDIAELQAYINRAAALTRQLLLFSRRQVTQMTSVDVNSLMGNLMKMLRRIIGEDISLEFVAAPGAAWVHADSGMLEQVVLNLAVNSRDAMPHGGRLKLSTSTEVIGPGDLARSPEARPGRFVCITVTDVGCGMDQATLNRIFEPFFTTKEPGKGTGLGLATAYGIVKKHEGWMEVTSEVGKGTTFRVFLPEKPSETVAPMASRHDSAIPTGTETVLYVEDDNDVRNLGVAVMQKCGYQVLVAHSAADALSVWRTHGEHIDLLLTDMIMPGGMTGLELASELRRSHPSLPAIITSGYSLELSQDNWQSDALTSFLAKPFAPQALGRTLRATLDAGKQGL
ncbi:MAG: ATP-binding protein [Opitutaceae bacterium]|nr:ATP-binding protein [Opitutaceae bacterium]